MSLVLPPASPHAETVPLLLIADDFGLTPAISASILTLIRAGRLSGTGAMTNCPDWPNSAAALAALKSQGDAGLHLNLTALKPLGSMPILCPEGHFPTLKTVARLALLKPAVREEIRLEIIRQIDAFVAHYGALPLFIDGHRHVHVLPGVRAALFEALAHYGDHYRPMLRDTYDQPWKIFARGIVPIKALVIAGLAYGFEAEATARGYPTNQGFSGVGPFNPKRDFAADMRRFITHKGARTLVMVHPGLSPDPDLVGVDGVIDTRPIEHDTLMSDRFLDDLRQAGFHIGRIETV
jgi:predicted glycoside hydrolase/deacetylase ChbG (UPF0249 family)